MWMYLVGIAQSPLTNALEGLLLGSGSNCQTRLRMRRDRNNRDLSAGPIAPQDSKCGWRPIFSVCAKDLLAIRAFHRFVFVRVQSRMARVHLQMRERLPYGFQAFRLSP